MSKDQVVLSNSEQDQDELYFNMRKLFKSPEEVVSLTHAIKATRRALKQPLQGAPFFFHTAFPYQEGEPAPFLYIGQVSTAWRQAIKQHYRLRKEFAMGTCDYDEKEHVLRLRIERGKGGRPDNFKLLRKNILKNCANCGLEFVEGNTNGSDTDFEQEVEVPNELKAGKEVKQVEETCKSMADAVARLTDKLKEDFVMQAHTIGGRIREAVARLQATNPANHGSMIEQGEHIMQLIEEWELLYQAAPSTEREKEKNFILSVKKQLKTQVLTPKLKEAASVKELLDEWTVCMNMRTSIVNAFAKYKEIPLEHPQREAFMDSIIDRIEDLYDQVHWLVGTVQEWLDKNTASSNLQTVQALQKRLLALDAEVDKLVKQHEIPSEKVPSSEDNYLADLNKIWEDLKKRVTEHNLAKDWTAELFEELYQACRALQNRAMAFVQSHKGASDKAQQTRTNKANDHANNAKSLAEQLLTQSKQAKMEITAPAQNGLLLSYAQRYNQLKKKATNLVKGNIESKDLKHWIQELQDLQFDIRTWKQDNPKSTDLIYAAELRNKLNTLEKDLEAQLQGPALEQWKKMQVFDASALAGLDEKTQFKHKVPEGLFSKTGKIQTHYNNYLSRPAEAVEEKIHDLQEMLMAIQKWRDKNPKWASDKGEKSNATKLKALEEEAFQFLKQWASFGSVRDNYSDIMLRYRGIKAQMTKAKQLDWESLDLLGQQVLSLEEDIVQWQNLHIHLSGFGNMEYNKRLTAISIELRQFSQTFFTGLATDKCVGNFLAKNNLSNEQAAYLAFQLAEKQLGQKPEDPSSEYDVWFKQRHDLAARWIKESTDDPEKQEARIKLLEIQEDGQLGPAFAVQMEGDAPELNKKLQTLLPDLKELAQTEEQFGQVYRSKLLYEADGDKPWPKLKSSMQSITEKGKNVEAIKKADAQKTFTSYKNHAMAWEAYVAVFEDNDDLLKRKLELIEFRASDAFKNFITFMDSLEGMYESIDTLKMNKLYQKRRKEQSEEAATKAKTAFKQVKGVEGLTDKLKPAEVWRKTKQLFSDLPDKEAKVRYFEAKETQCNNLIGAYDNALKNIEDAQAFDEQLQSLPDKVSKTKDKQSKAAKYSIDQAKKNLETQFGLQGKGKESERWQAKETIFKTVKAVYDNYQSGGLEKILQQTGLSAQQYLDNLRIDWYAWNEIIIHTEDPELKKELQAQTQFMLEVQQHIRREEQRLQSPNDPALQPRPDALWNRIDKLYQALLTEQNPKAEAIFSLKELCQAWLSKHVGINLAERKNMDFVQKTILPQVQTWLQNQDMVPLYFKTALDLEVERLENRLKTYTQDPDFQNQHDAFKELLKELKTKQTSFAQQLPQDQYTFEQELQEQFTEWAEEETFTLIQLNLSETLETEKEILAPFQGVDVYADLSNISGPSDDEKKLILATIKKACKRALKLLEIDRQEEAELLVNHIPVSFWPPELIEGLRLWREIQAKFFDGEPSTLLATYEQSPAKQFIGEVSKLGPLIEKGLDIHKAIKNLTNKLADNKKKGDYPGAEIQIQLLKTIESTGLFKGKNKEERNKPLEGDKLRDMAIFSGLNLGKEALATIANLIQGGLKTYEIVSDENWSETRKLELALLWTSIVAETTTRAVSIIKDATQYAANIAQAAGASAETIKSLGPDSAITKTIATSLQIATTLISAIAKAAKDGQEAQADSLATFLQAVKPETTTVIKTFCSIGASAGQIASFFCAYCAPIADFFNLISDFTTLYKDIKAVYKQYKALQQNNLSLQKAAQLDDETLPAFRHEVQLAKINLAKASIDLAGDTIKTIGTAVSLGGSIATAVPEPHAQAGGYAAKIAAKVIQALGIAFKLTGHAFIAIYQDAKKRKIPQLLELARKGDQKAQQELMQNSSQYAKMALVVLLIEENPLAIEFAMNKGISEAEISKADAAELFGKLIEATKDSADERTILQKIKDLPKPLINFLDPIENFLNQKETLNTQSLASFKSEMIRLEATMTNLRVHKYVLSGNEEFARDMQAFVKTFKKIWKQLQERKQSLATELDQILQDIEDFNEGDVLLQAKKILALETKADNIRLFIQTLHEGQNRLNFLAKAFN